VASLALIDTLKDLQLAPLIKWPNDILVNRRKLAGILIENGISGTNLSHTIIGIGLNLNQTEFPSFPVEAGSVALELGVPIERDQVLDHLLDALLSRYSQLENGYTSKLESDYLDHLFLLDRPGFFMSGGKKFTGVIRGLGEQGELVVEQNGKTRSYGFQEIKFILKGN
jgi:BirA family biotin operon repressor/biotin-[acetyl-CoA-carboxylase] ligase